jgi:cysteine synthase
VTRSRQPRSVLDTIGHTPLVRLSSVVDDGHAEVHVKLEGGNPTGSYKDRMALAMIERPEQRGALHPGMSVVEYTGGSTGSSLAMVCAVKGYRFQVVSSDAFAAEKLATMRAFGAELTIVPSDGGMLTADLAERMIAEATRLADQPDTYFTDQLHNRDAIVGYRQVGLELLDQLPSAPEVFCAAVGTAGLLMGIAGALRDAGAGTRVVAVEPSASPVLTSGRSGAHQVEGVGIGFVPPLLDLDLVDHTRAIDEDDGRAMAARLTREEGIFAGTSTGLNVVAALQLARELGPGHTVVTIACDTGLKYLAGDLYRR